MKNEKVRDLICTPKVRHFRRCIFFMGKKGKKQKSYSAEFKVRVIMDMREHRYKILPQMSISIYYIEKGEVEFYRFVILFSRIYLSCRQINKNGYPKQGSRFLFPIYQGFWQAFFKKLEYPFPFPLTNSLGICRGRAGFAFARRWRQGTYLRVP